MTTEKLNPFQDTIIKATGEVEAISPGDDRNTYTLEEMQKVVGGLIEIVNFPNQPVLMVVNEEGLIHRLPANQRASMLAERVIVGDVLLCGVDRLADDDDSDLENTIETTEKSESTDDDGIHQLCKCSEALIQIGEGGISDFYLCHSCGRLMVYLKDNENFYWFKGED